MRIDEGITSFFLSPVILQQLIYIIAQCIKRRA